MAYRNSGQSWVRLAVCRTWKFAATQHVRRKPLECGRGADPPSRRWLQVLAVMVALAVPSVSWGQAAKAKKPAAAEPEVEEITVTAQKREEPLQETPLSVTALTSEALEQKGVADVVDLGQAAPNVRIVSNPGSPASTTISMRGVAQGDPQVALNPKVGLYVDGVYIAKIVGSNLDLDDLDRVEVLRGPQGTLYGRNTIGGAVNFITKKPDEQRSITLKTEGGNFDTFNGRLTFNAPLIGKNASGNDGVLGALGGAENLGMLSLRQTVGYKEHDGFFRNALPNNVPADPAHPVGGGADYANLDRLYTTTALRWQPNEQMTFDYSLEYHRYRDHPTAFQLTHVYPGSCVSATPSPFCQLPSPNPLNIEPYILKARSDEVPNNAILMRDLQSLHQLRDDGNHRMHILTGTWDLGDLGALGEVTLKSISSYRSFTYQSDQDLDGSPVHIAEFSQMNDIQHWSEELQWNGTLPRVHYVGGLYYYGEYAMQNESQVFFGGANNLPYKNTQTDKAYAPYGQATWTPPILGDKLRLTAGIRYTQEQIHMNHNFLFGLPANTPGAFSVSGGKGFDGWDAVSPMGDVSYQWTEDLMTYARVSRGYQSGGFTPTAPTPDLFDTFKPERLLAFEAGLKSQWFDNRLRINTDGFFSYYENLQVSVFHSSPTLGAFSEEGNADRAEIYGMEFEGAAVPVRGLEATVNYSFLAPKYTKWEDFALDPNTGKIIGTQDVSGQRAFPFSPNHQVTVGLTYTAPPTTTGIFSAHVDTYWQDKVVFIANNMTEGAQADEGWAYAVVNGRLAYTGIPLQKGSLDLAVFAHNLFDRQYRTYGIDFGPQLGYAGNVYGDPRTFGVQLIYNFAES